MFQVEEFPEIWVDACLRNSDGRLMFLSLYGRDGSVMQFLAALELGRTERGVDRFHLVNGAQRHPTDVESTDRLAKQSVRLPRQNLFGQLSHMWLYDKALQTPDRANRIAWVMSQRAASDDNQGVAAGIERVWRTVLDLSPVALLDHWRDPLLSWCREKRAIEALDDPVYPAIGRIEATRVSLSDHFVQFVSDGVRSGLLTP